MAAPNGAPPQQFPMSGEMVIAQSQVSIGAAPNGQIVVIINPHGTALQIVVMMGKPEASQVGKALVQQGSGIVMPP